VGQQVGLSMRSYRKQPKRNPACLCPCHVRGGIKHIVDCCRELDLESVPLPSSIHGGAEPLPESGKKPSLSELDGDRE
jgi:hypothetical protein